MLTGPSMAVNPRASLQPDSWPLNAAWPRVSFPERWLGGHVVLRQPLGGNLPSIKKHFFFPSLPSFLSFLFQLLVLSLFPSITTELPLLCLTS